jgi:rhodanese-related sulfurtransferase
MRAASVGALLDVDVSVQPRPEPYDAPPQVVAPPEYEGPVLEVPPALEEMEAGLPASWSPPSRAPASAAPGSPVVLDVRTAREYRAGHLPGARLIPVDELEGRMAEVANATEGDWTRPIHVYCRRGLRAERAAKFLRELGFENVTNMGGLETTLAGVQRPQVLGASA